MRTFTAFLSVFGVLLSLAPASSAAGGRTVNVEGTDALRRELRAATAGTRILIAPGRYAPGEDAQNLRGSAEAPIVIEGADPKNKPVFQGGLIGIQLSGCAYLTLRN